MPKTTVAAIDLGATSGRVIVGRYSAEGLELSEIHRFPNSFQELGEHAYWDIGRLFSEISKGLKEAVKLYPDLRSCGVDTWGVDYVMLDRKGRLVFPVHAYRDKRTEPFLEELKKPENNEAVFGWTGVPPITYNTSLQLAETVSSYPAITELCDRVLHLPDYINFLLSGKQRNEFSICSTGQLLEVNGERFSADVFRHFNIPQSWFDGPAKAGENLGKVRDIDGLEDVEVILVPGHDTSCAFEAIPSTGKELFVSAGTWLLVGGLTENPATGAEALKFNVTNERTGNGGYRPTYIILGLWLLEQILPYFSTRPTNDAEWTSLIDAAEELPMPITFIDTSDRSLFNPDNMKKAIDQQLISRGGTPPENLPGYVRLICESLGQAIGRAATQFGDLVDQEFEKIIIVGGGSKNRLLCQCAANYAGKPVISYTLEGTAVGNIAYQLLGLRVIKDLGEFHTVLEKNLPKREFKPNRASHPA